MTHVQESKIFTTLEMYWDLASDPMKRHALVTDKTCIQFLAYVLENREPSIVMSALQILKLLSGRSEHRAAICSVFGVLEAVEALVDGEEREEIAHLAVEVLKMLTKQGRATRCGQPLRDSQNECPAAQVISKKHTVKPGLKTTMLEIRGLATADDRKLCEHHMIRVKGVISITFGAGHKLCIVQSLLDVNTDDLIKAVASTNIMCAKVVNNENKKVVASSSFYRWQNTAEDKENIKLPRYLADEDEGGNSRAVAVIGGIKQQTTNWFSSAATFISKSFYW